MIENKLAETFIFFKHALSASLRTVLFSNSSASEDVLRINLCST